MQIWRWYLAPLWLVSCAFRLVWKLLCVLYVCLFSDGFISFWYDVFFYMVLYRFIAGSCSKFYNSSGNGIYLFWAIWPARTLRNASFLNLVSAPFWYMKFCSIFFGTLTYNSAYSYLLKKIMLESRFKSKLWGEISVLRNWDFWVWSLFLT